MRSVFEKLTQSPEEGFVFKSLRGTGCDCPWHFHTEHELILVLEGAGHRIIGDNISRLTPGDIVLVGANLPHVYKYDDHSPAPRHAPHCLLIQFDTALWSGILELPTFTSVRRLLRRSSLGLCATGSTGGEVEGLMQQMNEAGGVKRIALFLEILDTLASSRGCRPISSSAFSPSPDPYNEQRVNRVCQYINENLHQRITVPQAARLVNMSEGAFSRFFRVHMGKTFPVVVNELRIGRACQLLAETDAHITQVAMFCGYNNLSNFNRQFLKLKGMTPRKFRTKI